MRKLVARIAFYSTFVLILLAANGAARRFYDDDVESVSDGLTNGLARHEESFLHFKRMDSSEEQCQQMYGFLPCSSNLPGHIFLTVIYEYLLYHGESYAGGDGRIFHVFNDEVGVSIFSQLLDSLPESLILLDSGIDVDSETRDHAKIMLFSVIPLVIILIPRAFGVSYSSQEYNFVALLSLFIALFCLCYYFYYQYIEEDKRILNRILEYADLERKIEMHVPYYEVQALMRKRDKHLMEKQIEMENQLQPLKHGNTEPNNIVFDIDTFNKWIDSTRDTFNKWIDSTRRLMDDPYTDNKKTEFNQVAQLLRQDKIKVKELIQKILDDNLDDINNFFELIDTNNDSSISPLELKNFIIHQYENRPHIHDIADDLVEIFMELLDANEDGRIEKDEFKSRATRWLKVIKQYPEAENDKTDKYKNANAKARKNGRFKAIALLLLGISMLTVLVEPLTQSVRIFSENLKIAPFYVSFILVPLATNARAAIAAIIAAKQKRHHTTSLTFSQIYHKVFMNNILGFSVLVSVIYFRGLTWHFSAEVLVLVIVCVLIGLYASFSTTFPNWTLFLVFPLYPLSLVLVYYVNDTFTFT